MEKRISVVIPVYNGESKLRACLDSVFNLCYSNFEVVIVDDASSDRSVEIAKNYDCKIISLCENRGAGAARDRGVSQAQGEIIAFLDADCIVPEDWLSKINKKITPDIIGISGKYILPKNTGVFSKIFLTIWDPNNILYKKCRKIIFCLGGNCAFWKSVLMKSRPKKELLYCKQIPNGDDTIMCSELNKYGTLLYDPDIYVIHNKTTSFSGIFKKSVRAGYTGIIVSNVCGRLLLKEPYRVYKFLIYLMSMFLSLMVLLSVILVWPVYILALTLLLYIAIQMPIIVEAYRQLALRFSLVLFPFAIFITNIFYLFGQIKRAFVFIRNKIKSTIWQIRLVINVVNPRGISKLFIFITKECNANCKFCFNNSHAEVYKRDNDLSLKEIEKITKRMGFVPSLTITGGEPFLRNDIYEICSLFYLYCGTKIFTIATNGMQSSYITKTAERLLTHHLDIALTILVGLDDIGEKHDLIKGVKDCYRRASTTLERLYELKLRFPNLTLGINTILTNENASSIECILNYFSDHFSYDRQALNLLRRPAATSEEPALIGIKKYFGLVQAINKKLMKSAPNLKQKLNQIFLEYCYEKSIREFNLRSSLDTCLAAKKFFVMNNGGNIFPCEILLEPLGNIRNEGYEFNKVTQGKRARDIQVKIRNGKCYCQWPCAVVNNTLFNGKSYFRLLRRMIFAQMNPMAQCYSYNDN